MRRASNSRSAAIATIAAIGAAATTIVVVSPAGARVVDLDDLRGGTPYVSLLNSLPRSETAAQMFPGVLLCDLDRDGWDEAIIANDVGFTAYDLEREWPSALWQHNVPPEWTSRPRAVGLGCARDLDGDGYPEILMTVARPCGPEPRMQSYGSAWRLWIYDPRADRVRREIELPVGMDRQGDGVWDGRYWCFDVLRNAETGGAPAALLMRWVGYDAVPRGIVAVDVDSGRELWHYDLGANPCPLATALAEVDGDGLPEIVLTAGSPDNLSGRQVNGTSDDVCVLLVLNGRGRLQWSREIGPALAQAWARAADLDGDGRVEIATVTNCHGPAPKDKLAVWAGATGEFLAERPLPSPALGLEVLPGSGSEGGSIYVGLLGGGLNRYSYQPRRLGIADRAVSLAPVKTAALADVLPASSGPELLALSGNGRAILFDPHLRPLATFDVPNERITPSRGELWSAGPQARYLYVEASTVSGHVFDRAPNATPAWLLWWSGLKPGSKAASAAALAIVLAAAVLGLIAFARARRERRLRALLRDLEVAGHGAMAVTQPLRRLTMLLSALQGSSARNDALIERISAVRTALRDEAAPRVRAILDLAAALRIDPESERTARSDLETTVSTLDQLFASDLPAPAVASALPGLRAAGDRLESALKSIRVRVEGHFGANPTAAIAEVLAAHEDALRRFDVSVSVAPPASDGDGTTLCLIDPGDLRFILDNLVDNARRAMAGSPRRQLTIRQAVLDGTIAITVADTGPGVPADKHELIFRGCSDKPGGGGVGLKRSREILARWGGELVLEDGSAPGGAVFRLTLRARRQE